MFLINYWKRLLAFLPLVCADPFPSVSLNFKKMKNGTSRAYLKVVQNTVKDIFFLW